MKDKDAKLLEEAYTQIKHEQMLVEDKENMKKFFEYLNSQYGYDEFEIISPKIIDSYLKTPNHILSEEDIEYIQRFVIGKTWNSISKTINLPSQQSSDHESDYGDDEDSHNRRVDKNSALSRSRYSPQQMRRWGY